MGGFVLMGVGAIAGGAAIGVGVQALAARDDYDASGNRDADARSKAASLRTVTNVLWAGAGALAIAGTVMVIVGWEDEGDASVSLEIGPASLGLRGRF
ncbi:MAG: hypothetical protein R3B72_07630 [Polyangiaceae bacterium]